MKTKEELNALREEVRALNQKLAELTEDELNAVTGGAFEEGTGLHVPPELPAAKLAPGGYENMFTVPDSPDSEKQYEFHFYSAKKTTEP